MRQRSVCGIALFLVLLGIAGPAFAQGGGGNDVNEEVRRAVERAVGASVSTSVAESLSRSIVSEGLRQPENTTIFFSPFYNRTDGDFDFASFKADTGGGTALYAYHSGAPSEEVFSAVAQEVAPADAGRLALQDGAWDGHHLTLAAQHRPPVGHLPVVASALIHGRGSLGSVI